MAVATPAFKRHKAHIVYKTFDGKRVPGTTTICGLLDKSTYLIPWANKLGLEGIDCNEYRDGMAGVGTLAHAMVQAELAGGECAEDVAEYSPKEIALAENALIKFLDWRKTHTIEPIWLERPFVSEDHRYGGTIDCYCLLDGKPTLVDFKTSKRIYDDMVYQLAAYRQLLREHLYDVENTRILRIGRDEMEGFEEREFTAQQLDVAWEVFARLREIYDLKKRIGG